MIRFGFAVATAAVLVNFAGSPSSPAFERIAQTGALQVQAASPQTCNKRMQRVLKKTGGSFALPKCAGWAGEIAYPSAYERSVWGVTSSATDDFGAPPPPSGTALFYMRMTLHHPSIASLYADNVSDTVTTPSFNSDHTYTLNVYFFAYNDQCPSTQCTWTMNIGSPQSGSHSITFVSPLNGSTTIGGSDDAIVWQFVQN